MIKKILVRAPNWVGDGVMSTPALAVLRSHFTEAEITVLAKPAVAALLSNHPDIDRIIVYEKHGKDAGLFGFFRLAFRLRQEQFDLAFLIHNAFEAALLVTLAGIPQRVGYDTDRRGFLLTRTLSKKNAPVHQGEAFSALVSLVGASLPKKPPMLLIKEEELALVWKRLEAVGISKSDRIIGIHPSSATGPAKQWIPDRFAEVADRLSEGSKIVILGGPNDRAVNETVLRMMKQKGWLLDLSLREMIVLIWLCDLCITNDSGPMHIASALGIPYIALYGSTDPLASFPAASFPGGKSGRKIYHQVNCSPCWLAACPVNHHCMTAISVQEVLQTVEELIRK